MNMDDTSGLDAKAMVCLVGVLEVSLQIFVGLDPAVGHPS